MSEKNPAAEYVSVAHLKGWKDNPRKNEHAVGPLKESIERFGFAAPIVARKADGMIIAGHTRLKAALELRMTEVPVRWLDISETDARLLALADNKLGELADWDEELLNVVLNQLSEEGQDIDGLGWTEDEISELLQDEEDGQDEEKYTHKVQSPIYEITGEKPDISELVDLSKASELTSKISKADITEEERFFLLMAAQRHMVFRYDRIAEFYAHSRPELQRLMEDLALVIIDFDRAIELGFVKLTKEIAGAFEDDHG